jgi:hypothetical protein
MKDQAMRRELMLETVDQRTEFDWRFRIAAEYG